MKILFVTPAGFDYFYGSNHLNKAMIIDLLNKGHEVIYIQSNVAGPYDRIPIEMRNYEKLKVINIRLKNVNKHNKLQRYLLHYNFQRKAAKEIKRIAGVDLAYLQSSGVSALLIRKLSKLNIPTVFNIQDLFPESLVTTGMIKKGLLYRWFKRKQIKSFKLVDYFTVISADLKYVLENQYQVPKGKTEVVYNWYSEADIKEVDLSENRFAKKYSLDKNNKFIIQYAGNLGHVLDYNFLIEYAQKLNTYQKYKIQIIGTGSNEKYLKSEISRRGLKNVDFFDLQPNNIVSDIYSFSDLEIVPLKKGVIFHSVPSKVPLVMKCNRPVLLISDPESEYSKMLSENNAAICLSNSQVDEAIKATVDLFSNKTMYKKLVDNAANFTKLNFSQSTQIEKIYKLFQKIVTSKVE